MSATYIVSDLHMGDGSDTDNFAPYKQRFLNFLDKVQDEKAKLIIAGDAFEFWEACHGDVVKANFDLIARLLKMDATFVVGNHDVDLMGFIGMPLGCANNLVAGVDLEFNGRVIHICHGHEFDIFNDANSMFTGKLTGLLFHKFELDVGRNKAEWVERVVEPIVRKIMLQIIRFYRRVFARTSRERLLSPVSFMEAWRAINPNCNLISGHTHMAGRYKDWHLDCGSWQDTQAHYVKICGPLIALYRFPQNELVEFI